jgi:hypothetical protein
MTYQVFVKQEAINDLEDWLNEIDTDEPGLWLSARVRLCTQPTAGWIVINVSHEDWWKIRDFFPIHDLFSVE